MTSNYLRPFSGRPRLALLLTLLAACGPASPVASPSTAPAQAAADPAAGAEARLESDVRALASPALEGRGTGTEGADAAARLIEERFATLGLAPFGDPLPDGSRSFRQRFEARVGATVDPPSVAIDLGRGGEPIDAASVVTADGSESGEVSGEALFVGHGISAPAIQWDDYAGLDLTGKVAVVLDGIPSEKRDVLRDFGSVRYKLRTAREHGATGVVVVTGGALPASPTDASGMGVVGVVVTRPAAASLLDKTKRKPASVTLTTHVTPRMAEAWNVVAKLDAAPGSAAAGELVVLGAHYDHLGHGGSSSLSPGDTSVHPGADDNASGTALVLEAARRLASDKPRRSVVFIAFGAEEIGALGSRYWIDHPPVDAANVTAMVNADMVGRLREDRLLVDGVGTAAGWDALLEGASKGLGLALSVGAEGFGASDHASFTAARVPVAFFFTGVHDDYHRPSDTADKINYAGLSRVTTVATRLVEALTERDARLVFVDAPADPHRGMRGGFRVSLGTIPDYAYQGKGVRLSGVRPDAPAARGGLLAGDVIVRVGAHAITNIHDYMFALGDLEPGREVAIEVLRADEQVTLRLIPAPGK